MTRRFIPLVICLLLGTGLAISPSRAQDLPDAKVVLDKYVEATGGEKAYSKIKNRVTEARMEIVGQNIVLKMTVYAARPNLVYSLIESDVTGKIESGCDGSVVWENSLIKGPEIKTGTTRAAALRDFAFDRFANWSDTYDKAEVEGIEDVDGKACYKVVLSPKPFTVDEPVKTEPIMVFVDKQSGLIVKLESKIISPAGTIPAVVLLKDYQRVDGILIPHKMHTKVLNQDRVMTIDSVKHNQDLKDRFVLPDEIQALVKK